LRGIGVALPYPRRFLGERRKIGHSREKTGRQEDASGGQLPGGLAGGESSHERVTLQEILLRQGRWGSPRVQQPSSLTAFSVLGLVVFLSPANPGTVAGIETIAAN
jgi:hypothetical protein